MAATDARACVAVSAPSMSERERRTSPRRPSVSSPSMREMAARTEGKK